MKVAITMTGFDQTIAKMRAFEKKLQTKVLRKAGNEGSKPVLKAIKQTVPKAKKEYGPGGSLKKSMGRKVSVKKGRLWFGVGARTKYKATVAKTFRFWRDKQGRIHKAPIAWQRSEQPSRRSHLSERKTHFIDRAAKQSEKQAQAAVMQVLADACAEV